jgi:long-chain fatty acid transport protein
VAGIGVYVPSGLGSNWDGTDFVNISENATYEWNSRIGIVTIAPALAYKINDMVSVGATLNINYGTFDIKMHAGSAEIPIPPYKVDLGQYEESLNGWGYGATLGILVKPSEMLSLGATFRTASTVKFSGEARISNLSLLKLNTTSDINRDVTWPIWIAGGVAFKPVPKLTLTGDIQWTDWKKIDVMENDFVDPYWKAMMAQSGDDKREMYWSSKAQIRFGAEYRITNIIALRGGYYYDPSPAPDRTMNILLPNYDFNVLTLGLGYSLDSLQIDFGFEYLMGKERNVPFDVIPLTKAPFFKIQAKPGYESAMPGTYNMKIIVPNLSISYKF